MRRASSLIILGLSGIALLGGCSKKAGDGAQSADASATATTKMPKAGLWNMSVKADGAPATVNTQICMPESKPGTNPFSPPPGQGATCAKNNVSPTAGGGYAIDMQCTINGMTVTSKGDVSGDFDSNFKLVMKSSVSGPNIPEAMSAERASTTEASYVGPCPAGMTPGSLKQPT